MKILSLHVGQPRVIHFGDKDIETSIIKQATPGPLMLRVLNLEGDRQADLTVHGGAHKALYAYGNDAYPAWRKLRPQDRFEYGSMGENVCLDSLREDQSYVGDTYEVGDAVIQVAQPRQPCYKLAAMYQDNKILKDFMAINRPGVYYRVLREGMIDVGQTLKLVDRDKTLFSITEMFELSFIKKVSATRKREILQVAALDDKTRAKITAYAEIP